MTTFTTIQKELFTHFKIVIANEKNCKFKNFKTRVTLSGTKRICI